MEIKKIKNKELETKDLILKPFKVDYAEDMYNNWATDPNVNKFLSWDLHKSVDESRSLIEMWVEKGGYDWALYHKETGMIIGAINVVKIEERYFLGEVGYCMSSKFWGRGLMTQALGAVITFLFEDIGLNRVELKHAIENIGSGRVMEKNGLKLEGVLRQGSFAHGTFFDTNIYSILRSEYFENKNK